MSHLATFHTSGHFDWPLKYQFQHLLDAETEPQPAQCFMCGQYYSKDGRHVHTPLVPVNTSYGLCGCCLATVKAKVATMQKERIRAI